MEQQGRQPGAEALFAAAAAQPAGRAFAEAESEEHDAEGQDAQQQVQAARAEKGLGVAGGLVQDRLAGGQPALQLEIEGGKLVLVFVEHALPRGAAGFEPRPQFRRGGLGQQRLQVVHRFPRQVAALAHLGQLRAQLADGAGLRRGVFEFRQDGLQQFADLRLPIELFVGARREEAEIDVGRETVELAALLFDGGADVLELAADVVALQVVAGGGELVLERSGLGLFHGEGPLQGFEGLERALFFGERLRQIQLRGRAELSEEQSARRHQCPPPRSRLHGGIVRLGRGDDKRLGAGAGGAPGLNRRSRIRGRCARRERPVRAAGRGRP